MYVLGLSFFYHNSAACLLRDGVIVAAAEEERFTRKKNDPAFPKNAVEFCLDHAGISIDEVEYVSFYEKPFLKLERMILSTIENWPKGILQFPGAMTSGIEKNSKISSVIRSETGFAGDILFVKHHEAHAASAFFTSGFAESVIVTVDGAGEWDTTTVSVGDGNSVRMLETVAFPDSLGLFYSAFTQYL
jgi:carbamoyltransferase